jgi:hypothetical protein
MPVVRRLDGFVPDDGPFDMRYYADRESATAAMYRAVTALVREVTSKEKV